uniref:ACB domain-containing protein n=1 Tax=Parastrongyloides trichosuri TaxID=131310 RepID=A0A0N5A1G6_PARTI
MTNFKEAAEQVKHLKTSPSNDELLQLYALFKQATVGDNETAKPGMLDLKGKAKWNAWNEKKGLGKDEAEHQYVALVESLVGKYGL